MGFGNMGFSNLNDEENPHVPLQDHGQGAFPTREGAAVDGGQVPPADHHGYGAHFSPFPYMWPGNSSYQDMQGTHQSYPYDPRIDTNLIPDIIGHNHLQSPQIDPSFCTLGGNAPRLLSIRNVISRGKIGEVCRSIDKNDMFVSGGLRKVDACTSGLQNTWVNENVFSIQSNAAGGYPKNSQIGEAEGSNINWSQVAQSSLNLGCGAYMSHQNTDILPTGVNNNIKVGGFHAGKVDGSFLSLGIGNNPEAGATLNFDPREIASELGEPVGPRSSSSYVQHCTSVYPNLAGDFYNFNSNTEARAKLKFDPQEIASKLEEAVGTKSSSSYVQPHSSLHPNSASDFSSFNSNPIAFLDPTSNLGGWISPHNDDGVMQAMKAANVGMISDRYFSPHFPEASKQHNFFEHIHNNAGFPAKSIGGHSAPQSYTDFLGVPSTPFPLNHTYSSLPRAGYTRASELASDTSKPTWITTQPSRDLLGISHPRNTGDVSSFFGCNSSKGCYVTKDYLGQLSSADRVHSAHAFGNSMLPENTFLQMAESGANMPATDTRFPRRLGVQLKDAASAPQSSNQSLLSMNVGEQTRSNEHQSQNSKPPQHAKYLHGTISGQHQAHLPAQSNLQKSSLPTGQIIPNTRAGGPFQVHDRPPLKRRANQPRVLVPWGEKRRLVTIPCDSKMVIPAAPSTPAHIRWTGFDNPPPPEPSGHRCLICKRDLNFAPGVVLRPGNPPASAVLPCGHTFHAHCLQNITPDDQAHDPPCIPCAICET